MYTSFKVSITVLTYRRYNTCRASGLVQIAIARLDERSKREIAWFQQSARSKQNRLEMDCGVE
jgi:hypothetical protein